MSVSVGDIYVSMGLDLSDFTAELSKAEQSTATSTQRIKDRMGSVARSLSDLREQARMVKEQLSSTTDFRIRGDAALDRLHTQLEGVRQSGKATAATLDSLSLAFEENSRGARTYTQALEKIASDRGASNSVRQLARDLANEAREANADVAALEKRSRALDSMIAKQRRSLSSLNRQLTPKPERGPTEMEGGVPQYAAASAAARALEGTASVRAAERFLTGTLGLGPALQTVFPIIGGIAILDLLGNLVDRAEKFYETLKKSQEEPALIAEQFRQLNGALQLSNDQLDLQNAKLANEIAKLSGKPENGLLETLAEARVAADQLAESLDKDFESLNKLLAEHQVGFFKSLFTDQAQTKDLVREFGGGESGYLATGFPGRINQITGDARQQLDAVKAGNTEAEKKAALDQKNAINAATRLKIEKEFAPEIAKQRAELEKALKLQQEYENPKPQRIETVINGVPIPAEGAPRPQDQTRRIAQQRTIIDFLTRAQRSAESQFQNQSYQEKLGDLHRNNDAAELTRPFQNKMQELNAQIEAARNSLAAVGKTDTAETLAKSWGKAVEAIARVNNELAKHHQSLTLAQQAELLTAQDTLSLTEAETAWKTKLDETTDSITNRIAALRLMTDAIGKGAAATRQAAIESQVIQTLGTKYQDPEFMRTHAGDVAALRTSIGTQYDAQRNQQSAENIQKLTEQIDLEKSLALVESRGAEAVRLQQLAYQLRNAAMQGATKAELQAEADLYEAQRKNQSSANIANLDQQIDATKRLTAAQLQGAEQYRQAQLQLKYEEMQRNGASPAEIEQTKTLDTLQHRQQITEQALKTAMGYRNQLQAIDEQISAVEQLKAQWGDTQDIEISLKSLELERNRILTDQALAVGSARDGMAAFFREMATQSQSSAQLVYESFASAFNGINDELSKLMTGQKTSWASFLQSLGAQISKMGLMGLEQQIAAKITGALGRSQQQAGGSSTNPSQHAGGIIGELGKIFGAGTLKRDGNTPATALFVTLAGANGIPLWSTAGTQPPGGFDMGDLGITSEDLHQLEYGGERAEPRSSMETIANGALNKPPGVASQIANAGIELFKGLLKNLPQNEPETSGGVATTAPNTGNAGPAPGSQPGDVLTRDPSGLIIRQSGNFNTSSVAAQANDAGLAVPQNGPDLIGELASVASMLGAGSGKPDGSSGDPFYVKQAQGGSNIVQQLLNKFLGGASGSGGGDFFSSLFGLFGGGDAAATSSVIEDVTSSISYGGAFASGGKPPVGKISIVGEKGPELFVPHTAGTIIPNHKLAAMTGKPFGGFRAAGGSVDPSRAYVVGERGPEAFASIGTPGFAHTDMQQQQVVYYSIDARGTDPALTEQRTRAAIVAAHQSAIITSVQTSDEQARRRPQR